jgi:hypothetical protein
MVTSHPPIDLDAFPRVPYWRELREPVFECIETIINKIERERRAELEARAVGMRMFLLTHIRVARRTYEVVEALATQRTQLSLNIEVAVAVPPLARVLLESLFSVTYVFDDPGVRLPLFWQGAWKRIAEQYIEYSTAYGNDPRWQPWLQDLAKQGDGLRDDLARQGTPLLPAWLANPSQAPRWPNPGKMVGRCNDAWRKDTLGYFDVRYYGPQSNAAHLSGTGMLAQGGIVLPNQPESTKEKYFSDQFLIALTMLLSLISQYAIDVNPEPLFARRLVALWTNPSLMDSMKEVYDRCFKVKLEPLAAR